MALQAGYKGDGEQEEGLPADAVPGNRYVIAHDSGFTQVDAGLGREGGHTEDAQDTGDHSGLNGDNHILNCAIEAHTHDYRRQKFVKGGDGGKYDQCNREDEKHHFEGLFLLVRHFEHSIEEASTSNQVEMDNLPSFIYPPSRGTRVRLGRIRGSEAISASTFAHSTPSTALRTSSLRATEDRPALTRRDQVRLGDAAWRDLSFRKEGVSVIPIRTYECFCPL